MKKYSKIITLILVLALILGAGLQGRGVAQAAKGDASLLRLAGKGRVETSVEASKQTFKDGQAANVVLAGYNGEVDALTGTLLAHSKNAPLILTRVNEVPAVVKAELKRLGAKNIYILGGNQVVSASVEAELKKSYTVERISGSNREETAVALAKEVKNQADHVFLAKGYGVLADALSIGPASAINNIPVLLTNTNRITSESLQAMKDLGVKEVTIVGGNQAVSKNIENKLKAYKVNRISGSNRERTALRIAETFFKNSKSVVLTNGYLYVDALVGGYIGAKYKAPILLTKVNSISNDTKTFIRNNTDTAYILGGTKVISEGLYKQIERVIKGEEEPDGIDLPNRTIRYLETGEDVRKVQLALQKLGYNIAADGVYGPATRAAVLDFQKKYPSLVNDGIYGPATRTYMIKALGGDPGGGGNVKPTTTKIETRGLVFTLGKSSDQIRLLKDFFKARGESNVSSGYAYDKRTADLVRAYQKLRGLEIDGIAGKNTIARINQEIKDRNFKLSLRVPHIKNKGDLILINKSSNTLYFIRNGLIQNTYPVGTGKTKNLTPNGKFKIVVKYKNPSWGGAGIYDPIPGGAPNNPLGKRWMGISLGGGGVYGIHGNASPSSIGTYVSLGCVRMFNEDVEKFYEKVNIGTAVWIGDEDLLESYGVNFK